VRLIAQQYSFQPQCLRGARRHAGDVPRDQHRRDPRLRHRTTNINTMLVPGFVSTFTTSFHHPGDHLMPCHEFCGFGHEAMWAHVQVIARRSSSRSRAAIEEAQLCCALTDSFSRISGSPSSRSWRDLPRRMADVGPQPLSTWINNPEHYYRSVTAHGTVMGYVMPTLVAMGFGYAITELALKQPLVGLRWAWAAFWL
jgi:hypothetical protein